MSDWVLLADALAWPLVVLAITVIYRKQFAGLSAADRDKITTAAEVDGRIGPAHLQIRAYEQAREILPAEVVADGPTPDRVSPPTDILGLLEVSLERLRRSVGAADDKWDAETVADRFRLSANVLRLNGAITAQVSDSLRTVADLLEIGWESDSSTENALVEILRSIFYATRNLGVQ